MTRAVVLLPGSLAELVAALPFADALAASGAELVPQAPAPLVPLTALLPRAGEPLAPVPPERLAATIAAREADLGVTLVPGAAPARLLHRAAVPVRWGYSGGLARVWLTDTAPRPRPWPAGPARWASLAAAMGLAPLAPAPRLELPEALRTRGAERLRRARITAGEPLAAIVPAALLGTRRQPWAWWAELSRALRRARPEMRQILVVGERDLWLGVRLFEETAKIHAVVGPDLDLATLAAVLALAGAAAGGPGGRLALAAAVGTPTVRVAPRQVADVPDPAVVADEMLARMSAPVAPAVAGTEARDG